MLISEYIKNKTDYLLSQNHADERENQAVLRFLVEDSLEVSRIDFSTYSLSQEQISRLNEQVERLKNNEPLQYITKKAHFYGLELEVSPAVLIPRLETEELVHQVLKDFVQKKHDQQTFLEVGTGSGCISIALAKHLPNFDFIAIDISKEALEIAKKNAKKNNIVNIEFLEVDFLDKDAVSKAFSLKNINHLVSNPPYIRISEKTEMKNNVLDYEPHLALFVEEQNPLIFYKALINFFVNQMKFNTRFLYAEINQYLADETKELFRSFEVENCVVFKDLQENSRFIRASI